MRRLLIALSFAFLLLAPARGWVLPFEGEGGAQAAVYVARVLGAEDPLLAGLFLPEPPWRDGWRLTLRRLASPAGVRMAREATGVDYVLAAYRDEEGAWRAYFFDGRRAARGRFFDRALLARWAAGLLGERPRPVLGPLPDEALLQKALSDPLAAARAAEARWLEKLADRLYEYAALRVHGDVNGALPPLVRAFWAAIRAKDVKKMPEAGLGPVWRAFLAKDPLAAAKRLAKSSRLVDLTGAILLLHEKKDPAWRGLARRVVSLAPDYAWGWEMKSFAAFEEHRPEVARDALLHAIALDPENDLYWTNLGWAYYESGDLARAELASKLAIRIKDNPTARYNLGLFSALVHLHQDALAHYRRALWLDQDWEVEAAIEDTKNAKAPQMRYWEGFLLARAGRVEEARQALVAFLASGAEPALVPWARRDLLAVKNARRAVTLVHAGPRPELAALPAIAGEPLYLKLRLEATPALPKAPVQVKVFRGAEAVARGNFLLHPLYPPNTVEAEGVVGPIEGLPKGEYTLWLRFAGAEAELGLKVVQGHLGQRLLARDLLPRDLDGRPILPARELAREGGERALLARFLDLLHRLAPRATEKDLARRLEGVSAEDVRRFFTEALKDPTLLEPNAVIGFTRWVKK